MITDIYSEEAIDWIKEDLKVYRDTILKIADFTKDKSLQVTESKILYTLDVGIPIPSGKYPDGTPVSNILETIPKKTAVCISVFLDHILKTYYTDKLEIVWEAYSGQRKETRKLIPQMEQKFRELDLCTGSGDVSELSRVIRETLLLEILPNL